MKYPFNQQRVGTLPPYLLSAWCELAPRFEYSQRMAFGPRVIKVSQDLHAEDILVAQTIQAIAAIIDTRYFEFATIDVQYPKTYCGEHTDTAGSILALRSHKLHIPLITNTQCAHMWNNYPQGTEVVHLAAGEIYLYNNIDMHSCVNLSEVDRYHLILRYRKEGLDL